MAAVGIDMGNFSSYVGVARAGGVEIIANEYSDRLTPTSVTFDKSTRLVGQASKAMEVTNAKNTIRNFKRLLGRRYQDNFVQQEQQLSGYSIVEGNGNSVNIEVNYLNERKRLMPEQITAAMLTKLRDNAATETGVGATDCVIGVPCYFTDTERRAMLDSAYIAGWNCLRLLNETTAVALSYGIYKADLPEPNEKPRQIAFVDLGHTSLQASITAFNKGKLKVIATAFDPSLGGRDFDRVIMNAMQADFKQRYRVDFYSTIKAQLRLQTECEKAKKLMSSNVQPIPISLEFPTDSKDVSGKISRAEFEEFSKPLLDRIRTTLENLLKEAKMSPDDLESVEIVGGSSRIPIVKQIIQDVFRKPPMTTMNADEPVARGCTLMCAMLSPAFKVKEFKIEDCQPYPITVSWQGGVNEDNEVEVFSRWSVVPSTKMLSFYKREPLKIQARYSYPNDIPFSESRIGQYMIEQIQPRPDGTPSNVKVKVRLNRNGIFDVTNAMIVEDTDEPADSHVEQTEVKPEESVEPSASGPVEQPDDNREDDGTETKKTNQNSASRRKKKEIDLPITAYASGLKKAELDRLIEYEQTMISQNRKESERSDAKNSVEEYVYDMRSKLDDGEYMKFTDERTRQKFLSDLRTTEEWLYNQGADQERSVYLDRLKNLKILGDPIRHRYQEAENRQTVLQDFFRSLQRIDEAIQQWQNRNNDRYSHLEKSDIEKVHKILVEKQKWYDQTVNRLHALRPHEDPSVLCSQIKQERDTLERDCSNILNKPKPKVEMPKETSAETSKRSTTGADGHPPPPPTSTKKTSPSKNKNAQSHVQHPSMDTN